jgi:hypothetical protein
MRRAFSAAAISLELPGERRDRLIDVELPLVDTLPPEQVRELARMSSRIMRSPS